MTAVTSSEAGSVARCSGGRYGSTPIPPWVFCSCRSGQALASTSTTIRACPRHYVPPACRVLAGLPMSVCEVQRPLKFARFLRGQMFKTNAIDALPLPIAGERLHPEGQPRELFADNSQLVLSAGLVEPAIAPISGRIWLLGHSRSCSGVWAGTEGVVAERRRLVMDQPSLRTETT